MFNQQKFESHYFDKPAQGFTLIELSIVLVIIGLIVGGVLVGQDLIKASELRATASQIQSYQTAVNTFRLKYNGLPGDLKNATIFFPTSANGNGDKKIVYGSEANEAWAQLGLAGLVEGTYAGGGGAPISPGVNIPEGKIAGTGFSYYWATPDGANGGSSTANPNRLVFGKPYATWASMSMAALTPTETYSLDTKMDDGAPGSGKLVGNNAPVGGSGTCRTSSTAYTTSNSDLACYFTYAMD